MKIMDSPLIIKVKRTKVVKLTDYNSQLRDNLDKGHTRKKDVKLVWCGYHSLPWMGCVPPLGCRL